MKINFEIVYCIVNYAFGLLFDVSLMAGSTTKRQHTQHLLTTPRLPSTTPPRLHSITLQPTLFHQGRGVGCYHHHQGSGVGCYTTKGAEYYTSTYAAPAYYTAQIYTRRTAFFIGLNQFAIMGKYSFLFLVVNQFYRF